jgi:hypothetical protein
MLRFARDRTPHAFVPLLAVPWLACLGCGSKPSVAVVAGTVTVDGAPLAGATITTQPISVNSQNPGPGSFGHTDNQGHFELELVKPAIKGAVIGEHRVMVSPASSGASSSAPTKSADGVESWSDDPHSNRAMADKKWPAHFTDGSIHLTVPPEGNADVRLDLKR